MITQQQKQNNYPECQRSSTAFLNKPHLCSIQLHMDDLENILNKNYMQLLNYKLYSTIHPANKSYERTDQIMMTLNITKGRKKPLTT